MRRIRKSSPVSGVLVGFDHRLARRAQSNIHLSSLVTSRVTFTMARRFHVIRPTSSHQYAVRRGRCAAPCTGRARSPAPRPSIVGLLACQRCHCTLLHASSACSVWRFIKTNDRVSEWTFPGVPPSVLARVPPVALIVRLSADGLSKVIIITSIYTHCEIHPWNTATTNTSAIHR